ncbi:Ig-like domain-containing protein [Fulvivirga ligni]|uniref:Ig-like domain-containing protein n=1 Tax=Fulvivirga ligni TaxID=2904246 RepID=UPI001F48D396|nr:Ig-like domain-containing protein [Fulvivirga ligni]UII19135.1 Ig-like domain-containing protein [Fulvivirga ligni]
MNHHFSNSIKLLVFLTAVIFQSCSDDPEEIDDMKPEVAFTNLSDGDELWNTVNIQASATDDISVFTLELFIDDQLLAASENKETISRDWITGDLTDGPHNLKVVATDPSGNVSEEEITVILKNDLISLSVDNENIKEETSGYIFVSNEQGEVIVSAELALDEELHLRNSDFNGTDFYVTEAFKQGDEYIELYTYCSVKRGSHWTLPIRNEASVNPNYLEAEITFDNASRDYSYSAASNLVNFRGINELYNVKSLVIEQSPTSIYVTKMQNGQKLGYNMFSISEGQNHIDLNQINKPYKNLSFSLPEHAEHTITVEGYLTEEKHSFPISQIRADFYLQTAYIEYPDDSFDDYSLSLRLDNRTTSYEQRSFGLDNMVYKGIQSSFSFETTEGSTTYSTTGSFDVAVYSSAFYMPDREVSWELHLPQASNKTLPAFQLPEVLQEFELSAAETSSSLYLIDYAEIDGYNEALDLIKVSENAHLNLNNLEKNYAKESHMLTTAQGRKRSM